MKLSSSKGINGFLNAVLNSRTTNLYNRNMEKEDRIYFLLHFRFIDGQT